jgi:hypothetical protein
MDRIDTCCKWTKNCTWLVKAAQHMTQQNDALSSAGGRFDVADDDTTADAFAPLPVTLAAAIGSTLISDVSRFEPLTTWSVSSAWGHCYDYKFWRFSF